jgi:predicted site-specific integrase-resolvase
MAYKTTEDVAKILNVSVQSLRLYIRKGYLRCGSVPSGRVYRFSPQQVEDAKACFEGGKNEEEVVATPCECGSSR